MPEVSAAGTIAAYYSIGTEPDTHRLIFALWKRGSYVVLPVLLPDGDLDWASYEGPDSLAPGPRGLLEPTEPVRGPATVARADVVLVPALAVDARGYRLGRGGGSYDRALARVGGQVPTIALLYDDELLPTRADRGRTTSGSALAGEAGAGADAAARRRRRADRGMSAR